MKKFSVSLLIGLGLFVTEAQAIGPYDGIWEATYNGSPVGYYATHEKDGLVIAVSLARGNSSWEAFSGPRSGNTLSLSTLVSGVNFQGTVTFTSDSTFTARQVSCVPVVVGVSCSLPNGAILQGVKIW